MAETVARLYAIAADDPLLAAHPGGACRRAAPSAIWRCRSPSSWRAGCARPPRAIAQEIAGALGTDRRASRESKPRRTATSISSSTGRRPRRGCAKPRQRPCPTDGKAIVEHTAINPNKAAHIGHLRNAALGDTFGRLLRFLGREVEIQNYIDDTGVQVADVAVGFRELEHKTLDDVRAIADATRFDYYCWDLYARVTEWYEADKERLKIRAAALHDIEHGGNDTAALAALHRRPHRPRASEDDARG